MSNSIKDDHPTFHAGQILQIINMKSLGVKTAFYEYLKKENPKNPQAIYSVLINTY